MDFHFFDPNTKVAVLDRRLPHWSQAGVVCFVTFRTHDSMPKSVVERWRAERSHWLRQHDIDPRDPCWRIELQHLEQAAQIEFFTTFSERWHNELDQCHGSCALREPENAAIVAESLLNFDNDRYLVSDFVVMPNHAHLLVAFADDDSMLQQCEAWKRFTGRVINQRMQTCGRFWQQDGFDHLVRSVEQFEHFRRYIARNPQQAGLKSGDYLLWSRPK
ncbi:MAG: transposase [Planctomycetaceae bacterium]|jgi:putative transposase